MAELLFTGGSGSGVAILAQRWEEGGEGGGFLPSILDRGSRSDMSRRQTFARYRPAPPG